MENDTTLATTDTPDFAKEIGTAVVITIATSVVGAVVSVVAMRAAQAVMRKIDAHNAKKALTKAQD